jgi:hypothetical protein
MQRQIKKGVDVHRSYSDTVWIAPAARGNHDASLTESRERSMWRDLTGRYENAFARRTSLIQQSLLIVERQTIRRRRSHPIPAGSQFAGVADLAFPLVFPIGRAHAGRRFPSRTLPTLPASVDDLRASSRRDRRSGPARRPKQGRMSRNCDQGRARRKQ